MAKTILVVDDNEIVRSLLVLSLQVKGYKILEEDDGAKALARLEGEGPLPDLVITDLAMVGMGGLEMLAKLRAQERFSALPVIVCSAEEDMTEEALVKQGASAYVKKPFSPTELYGVVERLLK